MFETDEFKKWGLVSHSLGVNLENSILSNRKKDKYLPVKFYRNYFCSSKDSSDYKILKKLEVDGITLSWVQYSNIYFMVTEKGISKFRDYFLINVNKNYKPISKSAENYQKYLDSDTGNSYTDWLGIKLPKQEYRLSEVRLVSTKYNEVKGVFSKTLKDAKISYKIALKNYKKQCS